MNVEEQKHLARGIADLLARLEPGEFPLLRLQLAHWLARRIMLNRVTEGTPSQNEAATAARDVNSSKPAASEEAGHQICPDLPATMIWIGAPNTDLSLKSADIHRRFSPTALA